MIVNSSTTFFMESFSVSVDKVYCAIRVFIIINNCAGFSFILVFHHFPQFEKSFLYRLTTFSAAFKVWNIVLFSELISLLGTYFSLFFKIHFIPDKHHLCRLRSCLYQVFDPVSFIISKNY